tara:strand:- start:554 stop:772 length:219 start_codon:yes stop_codon:yes gene_type:complete
MDVKFPKTNLDKDLVKLSNNELAEYLSDLTDDVYTALKNNKLTLMNVLIGYKIRVERKLEERLKNKVETIKI